MSKDTSLTVTEENNIALSEPYEKLSTNICMKDRHLRLLLEPKMIQMLISMTHFVGKRNESFI